MIVRALFGGLAFLSLALLLWQWIAALRFPLHRRTAAAGFAPALSILKPLKGCDETTAASLASWLEQRHAGPAQILFGVADAGDPVCPVVEELLKQYPQLDAQLIVCGEPFGANGKIATLAHLEKLIKYDLVLVSDADVRVTDDFLANVVAPFQQDDVGLVNCFYRLANPATPAMQWEAVAVNADFWSQVLQSLTLKPADFALGAVILIRRPLLQGIGGFKPLQDCLADDFQIGRRVAGKNGRIAFCPVVVECWDAPMDWRGVWKHQLRWARTIRICRPLPYFFSLLSNATLWPLLWLGISVAGPGSLPPLLAAVGIVVARIWVAQQLQRRLTPRGKLVSPFWYVPLKDLLQTLLWLGAFAGNTVEWRGKEMRLRSDGTLIAKAGAG